MTAMVFTACENIWMKELLNKDPEASDFEIGNLTQTEGYVTHVTITPKETKSKGKITIYYNGSKDIPQMAGSYEVTFDVGETTGWWEANGFYAGTLIVTPAGSPANQTPVATDYTISGNLTQTVGNVTAVTITPKAGSSSGTITVYYTGTGGTTYAKSATPPTNAGTYTVTFDVDAATDWNAVIGLSAGTLTINKATGAAVGTPTVNGSPTHNSITVNAVSLLTSTGQSIEYAITTGTSEPTSGWQSETTFTGLSANTTYRVYARSVSNDNYNIGAASVSTAITTAATPSYSISLDKSGTHTFTAADYGYSTAPSLTVTVTNTGNQATGALTIAKSGADASSFTLSKTSITNITTSGATDTFTVVPNTGLAVGTYTATVTVSGSNSISAAFNVSFTVSNATPTAGDFNISNLTQTAGGVTAVTITPKAGKSTGSITIYYNGSTTIPQTTGTYPVTFNVAATTNWNAVSGLSAGTLTINSPPTFNSNTDLSTWLAGTAPNDASHPYTIVLDTTDLSNIYTIILDSGRYVYLDLSPSNITSIPNSAFSGRDHLVYLVGITIPNSVNSIESSAFFGCTGLTEITIPASVTSIEVQAFGDCPALTTVIFATGSNISDVNFGTNAFPEGLYGYGYNTLRDAYIAASTKAGTYTRAVNGDTWTKQP